MALEILAATAAPAMAASPEELCKSGDVAIVRVSKIIPTGTMAGFKKAVADHSQWYADHGYPEDRQVMAPVLMYDPAVKTFVEAPDQVMTLHTHAHSVPQAKHDAAWDAYVAEYQANSNIATETMVCLPKEH